MGPRDEPPRTEGDGGIAGVVDDCTSVPVRDLVARGDDLRLSEGPTRWPLACAHGAVRGPRNEHVAAAVRRDSRTPDVGYRIERHRLLERTVRPSIHGVRLGQAATAR